MEDEEVEKLASKAIRNRLARVPAAKEVTRVARGELSERDSERVLARMEAMCTQLRMQLRGEPVIEDDPDDDPALYPEG